MLEKGPWSRSADGGSSPSCDVSSIKDLRNMSPGNSRILSHDFDSDHIDPVDNNFCTSDSMLRDGPTAANNSLYNYSLHQIPETENDLSFFDTECNGKETDDLFYGWNDIGNFEDVDEMFRSCDSTFGLGDLDNEDDFSWFLSSQPVENSEFALTSDSKPKKTSENHEATMSKKEVSLADDDAKQNALIADSLSIPSQKKDELMPDEQDHLDKKQSKRLVQHERGKNRFKENGALFHHAENSNQILGMENQYESLTCQYYPRSTFQQTCVPNTHLNYDQSSDHMSVCQAVSGIKTEKNANPSSSSNESSYASNQAQSLESINGSLIKAPRERTLERGGKPQQHHDTHPSIAANIKRGNKQNMMVFSGSVPFQNIEDQNQVKQVSDIPAELDLTNAQESSCVSSVSDDISTEGTCFRQLQCVVEQLDIRTKLCIRDSLYRLAKSAQQRHNGMNTNGETGAKDAAPLLVTGEAHKYANFVDMETDTNPIDRSIAHLLFHRPSDSSPLPANDSLTYKSNPMPTSSPSLMVPKQEKKPVGGTDNKVKACNDK